MIHQVDFSHEAQQIGQAAWEHARLPAMIASCSPGTPFFLSPLSYRVNEERERWSSSSPGIQSISSSSSSSSNSSSSSSSNSSSSSSSMSMSSISSSISSSSSSSSSSSKSSSIFSSSSSKSSNSSSSSASISSSSNSSSPGWRASRVGSEVDHSSHGASERVGSSRVASDRARSSMEAVLMPGDFRGEFPVFKSVCDGQSSPWRIRGQSHSPSQRDASLSSIKISGLRLAAAGAVRGSGSLLGIAPEVPRAVRFLDWS